MIDQMNASNAVAAALVEKERELETLLQNLKERDLMIEENNNVIESLNRQILYKDSEISMYKQQNDELNE